MTEFVVTDPSGKEFVINAPEGATQDQALEYAKSQFGSTPGGAAVGNPQLARQGAVASRQPGSMEGLQAIGASGVMGAIGGATAPEALQYGGRVLGGFPQGRVLAPILENMGKVLATKRGQSTIGGTVSGLGSESAGQTAEALGAGTVGAEAARLAGGLGNEALVGGVALLRKFVTKPALGFISMLKKETGKTILEKIDKDPTGASLSEAEKKEFSRLIADLHGSEKPGAPAGEAFAGLEQGAAKARTDAIAASQAALEKSEKEANRTVFETLKGPVAERRAGAAKLSQIADDATEAAQRQRLSIGNDSELTDVGTTLRGVITEKHGQALAQREATIAADKGARNAAVAQLEGAGKHINKTPEFTAITDSIRAELRKGKHSPEVQSAYKKILSDLESGGVDTFGQQKPISFNVIDEVRRDLGQVFKGTPPEGYKAIDAGIARQFYDKLRDLQIKYAGEPQAKLLSNYAEQTELLKQFASKTGKKATAVDKIDMDLFTTDPANLPKHYFGSKTEVQNLVELVGDRKLVSDAARDFVTNQLRSRNTEASVRQWMTSNRDALNHPAMFEARSAAENYANALQRGERVARTARSGIDKVSTQADDLLRIALNRADSVRGAGQKEAAGITASGERFAETALGAPSTAAPGLVRANATARVRNLVESGSPEQWTVVAEALTGAPKAKAAMFDAVRQVIAERAEKSPTTVAAFFAEKVKPMVEATGVLTIAQTAEISGKLAMIARMQVPEQAKLGHMQRMILEALAGYSSSLQGRGLESASR